MHVAKAQWDPILKAFVPVASQLVIEMLGRYYSLEENSLRPRRNKTPWELWLGLWEEERQQNPNPHFLSQQGCSKHRLSWVQVADHPLIWWLFPLSANSTWRTQPSGWCHPSRGLLGPRWTLFYTLELVQSHTESTLKT